MFEIQIHCIETLDRLKKKCEQMGIQIVPYFCDQNFNKSRNKRTREIIDMKDEDHHIKQCKRQKIINTGEFRSDLKDVSGKLINVTAKHQNERLIRKSQFYGRSTKDHISVKSKSVIQSLDNYTEIQNQLDFYCQLRQIEKDLNAQLVKSKNKPITIRNDVDLELPPHFIFTNEYKLNTLDRKVLRLISESVQKCDCVNDCTSFFKYDKPCCYASFGQRIYYDSQGLIKNSIKKRGPIVECTKNCSCNDKCKNRVIQNGTQIRLEIFKTSNGRGWGLRTLERIPKNKFICAYRGEVITNEEALIRQNSSQFGGKYLFDLDFDEDLKFNYVVDSTYYSNLGRFINHSCSPNCDTLVAHVEFTFTPIPVIAFFSNQPINENEELTIDYFMDTQSIPTNLDKIACLCKAENCRKYKF